MLVAQVAPTYPFKELIRGIEGAVVVEVTELRTEIALRLED